MMGFGFVVARFGLFLRDTSDYRAARLPLGLSPWIGTALVALGSVVLFASALRFTRYVKALDRGEDHPSRGTALELVATVLLACVGLLMAAYLLLSRDG